MQPAFQVKFLKILSDIHWQKRPDCVICPLDERMIYEHRQAGGGR
jgi:hypothetical protein